MKLSTWRTAMTYKTLSKPPSSNKQVREYISALEKGRHSVFVMPIENNWGVRRVAAKKLDGIFSSQAEALSIAEKLAKSKNAEVLLFSQDGEIVDRR